MYAVLKLCQKSLVSLLLLFAIYAANGEVIELTSEGESVQLVELYTSQGCSSCPPADRKLSELLENLDLWSKIVPIGFHVDYWDRLGWKDPFATKSNTRRQYDQASEGNVKSVYTPCFVVNGEEWRGYFAGENWPIELRGAGVLNARIENQKLRATYSEDVAGLRLNVSILGVGIATDVKKGENRNRVLKQDFVSLWNESANLDSQISLPEAGSLSVADRYAIAICVSGENSMKPIQVTGGWLVE